MAKKESLRLEDLSAEQLEMLAVEKRKQDKQKNKGELERIEKELLELEEKESAIRKELAEVEQEKMSLENSKMKLDGGAGLWRDLDEASPTTILTNILYESDEPMTLEQIREQAIPIMQEMGVGGEKPEQSINVTLGASKRFYRAGRGVYALAGWARDHMKVLEQFKSEE